jgi:hypothetical protein
MVKINDPRGDTAAIAMRSLRATNTFKTIKKMVKKSKDFDEDKLDLHKIDKNFYNDFVSCPESIKQELIFLWEEVGDLYEELQSKEEPEEPEEPDYNVELDLDEEPPPPPPKRVYIFGP